MNLKLLGIPIINFLFLKIKWIYFQIYSRVILFAVDWPSVIYCGISLYEWSFFSVVFLAGYYCCVAVLLNFVSFLTSFLY